MKNSGADAILTWCALDDAILGTRSDSRDENFETRMPTVLWSGFHIWKRSKLFSIKSDCSPPAAQRARRSGIVPRWFAMPFESTSEGWKSACPRNAIARAIRGSRESETNRSSGRRRQFGRQNRQRRCPSLPVCYAGQETACGCAYPATAPLLTCRP